MSNPDVEVTRVNEYSQELAEGIGALMPYLKEGLLPDPIAEETLREIIDSQYHEQIVAMRGIQVIGSAALTHILGDLGRKAWLEDFVVHPEARGTGVADKIADEWETWCRERGITTLRFTSGWERADDAHKFYLRRGAVILNNKTGIFHYPVSK